MDLSKIKIGHSPLTNSLYIYRHGKDPALALDKREAQRDVIAAVVEYVMHDAPKGASQVFHFSDKSFEVTVKPITSARRGNPEVSTASSLPHETETESESLPLPPTQLTEIAETKKDHGK